MGWKQIAFGAGIGYVLGARAGEERFEQIQEWWKDLIGSPPMRRLTDQVADEARQLTARARFGGSDDEGREGTDEGARSTDRDGGGDSALARVGRFLSEARERGRIA